MNVANASLHESFKHFPDIGEDNFCSFLGAPIIYRKEILGVLVVQQRVARQFDEGEESFLVTLAAQLAMVLAHARAQGLWPDKQGQSLQLKGAPASPGIAIARVWCDNSQPKLEDVAPSSCLNIASERDRLEAAIEKASAEFRQLRKRFDSDLQQDTLAIFELFSHLLHDPLLRKELDAKVDSRSTAEWAVRDTVETFARQFARMEDDYLKERASDIRELGQRLIYFLDEKHYDQLDLNEPVILAAREINAAMLASIPRDKLAGIVAQEGAVNSHAAILARALGIPSVMGVEFRPNMVMGQQAVLDAYSGQLLIKPNAHVVAEYEELQREEDTLTSQVEKTLAGKTRTSDGTAIEVHLNAGLSADSSIAINDGVDGVGLYRTEVPFLLQRSFPSEDEQTHHYRSILETYQGKPVVMRTLDIGGDKPLPYLAIEEDNPFLGWRGIRFTLDHPEIFLIQIRAMLRASVGLDNLDILLPMISGIGELREARALIDRAFDEVSELVEGQGKTLKRPRIGIMVEVPSIVYQLDRVKPLADFLSVGTNDLTQYLLAVDRNNARVADVYDSFHPAVLSALQTVQQMASRQGMPVCVCGELAGDPMGSVVLTGLGYRALSMNTRSVARIKFILRHLSLEDVNAVVSDIMQCDSPGDIRALLVSFFNRHTLSGFVRAGARTG